MGLVWQGLGLENGMDKNRIQQCGGGKEFKILES